MFYSARQINLLAVIIGFVMTSYCLEVASDRESNISKCPQKCACGKRVIYQLESRLLTVNCSGAGYVDMPSPLPSNTQALILTNNIFSNLTHLGSLTNLKFLDISNNVIQIIDNHWLFEYLPNLHVLRLSDNAIRTLRHGSFSGLKSLQSLDLSHNILIHIELHAFGGLNHLVRLYLDHNQITHLNRSWFLSMSLLYEIYLAHNNINRLEANTFDMLSQLTHLDLSHNIIQSIDPRAFNGLTNLKVLVLLNNRITKFPSASLRLLPSLNNLNMDANPIQRLDTKSVCKYNLTSLSISYMPILRVIDETTFCNLTNLVTLQLHDNPALLYIHNAAFTNLPNLHKLYLHNNGLMGLSSEIQTSLPSLMEIHLYHNPLHCDCNIYWIKKQLVTAELRNTSTVFHDSDKLVCDSPLTSVNVPLRQVAISTLAPVCPPTTLPFFRDHYNISVGEELTLECQALGVPKPTLIWLLPKGKLNSTISDSRTTLKPYSISIKGVLQSDSGTYACKAYNMLGFDISSTAVNVVNKNLKLMPLRVTGDTITVSWKGKIPNLFLMNNYQLNYSVQKPHSVQHQVQLNKHIHRYTLQGLSPLTTYEFCLTYLKKYIVHCQNITTSQKTAVKLGITRITNTNIIVGISSVVGVFLCVVFVVFLIKKLRNKKGYLDPDGRKHDNMSHIPLENISQPPSTPLCSSRTALLPNSQI